MSVVHDFKYLLGDNRTLSIQQTRNSSGFGICLGLIKSLRPKHILKYIAGMRNFQTHNSQYNRRCRRTATLKNQWESLLTNGNFNATQKARDRSKWKEIGEVRVQQDDTNRSTTKKKLWNVKGIYCVCVEYYSARNIIQCSNFIGKPVVHCTFDG